MIKRILVLDDNQDILDIVKEALSYEKFEVNITSDARQIIEAIEKFEPDLVIVDHKLNGYNGDDICREIKASPQTNEIPVIICSAYLNGDDDLWACGCDAIIAKPFGFEELIDKVNGLIAVRAGEVRKSESPKVREMDRNFRFYSDHKSEKSPIT